MANMKELQEFEEEIERQRAQRLAELEREQQALPAGSEYRKRTTHTRIEYRIGSEYRKIGRSEDRNIGISKYRKTEYRNIGAAGASDRIGVSQRRKHVPLA
jgi:hypothetical protein